MSFNKQAEDWKVAGAAQVGGAATVGAGLWLFTFQSESARYSGSFVFGGYGLGLGGSIGGVSAPDLTSGRRAWSDVVCEQTFSAADLNWSGGRLTTAGAGLSVGYGLVYISAFNSSGPLFDSQSVGGFSIGVGASVMVTAGLWKWVNNGVMQRI